MIISHKFKFIFIKTRKTAGTSIEVFLSQHCSKDDILTPITPHVDPHAARNYRGIFNPIPELLMAGKKEKIKIIRQFKQRQKFNNHLSAWKIKSRIPKKTWEKYFKFCVERNPWDKTISHYHMINARFDGNMTLDDYLKKGNFCRNFPAYTDKVDRDQIIVDQIIKYETLIEELGDVFNSLGIPFEGSLNVNAKSEYRKNKRHYREEYNKDQRELIREAFKKEIEYFGYKFGE